MERNGDLRLGDAVEDRVVLLPSYVSVFVILLGQRPFHISSSLWNGDPTLFNIAAITSLRPTGDYFDLEDLSEDVIGFAATKPTYTTFINHFHDKVSSTVSEV